MNQDRLWKTLLTLMLLGAVLLAGCSPAPTTVPATPPPATEEVTLTAEPEEYPAPNAEEQPAASGALYPGPKTGDEVTWSMAYGMIMNSEVLQIQGANSDKFTLVLKDGRSLVALQPAPGDVINVINNCGEPCAQIQVQE